MLVSFCRKQARFIAFKQDFNEMKLNKICNFIIFWLLQLAKVLTVVIGYLILAETFSIIPTTRRSDTLLKELNNVLKALALFPSIGGFAIIVRGVRLGVASQQRNGGLLISAGGLTLLGFAYWRGIGTSWLGISVTYVVIGLLIIIFSLFTQPTATKEEEVTTKEEKEE